MSTTNVSELGYLFLTVSSLHKIASDLNVRYRLPWRMKAKLEWCQILFPFPQTQKLVFLWFLRIYFTSAPYSCWNFLLLKQRIFWYYSSLRVMAILCCVAKKAASGVHKQYFKILISHNRRVCLAPSLLQCQSSPISSYAQCAMKSVPRMLSMR